MEDVLLVDDEQPVLDSLLSSLDWAEYGFKHIHIAQDAKHALRILKDNQVDLLITDVVMPDISGLELVRTVRKQYPLTHCVLLSAHSNFEYAREALKLGVENYLLKPIDISELQETVYRTVTNITYMQRISNDLFDRNILIRWLHGRISADELVEHSRYTNLNVLMRRYRVVVIKDAHHSKTIAAHLCTNLGLNYTTHRLTLEETTCYVVIGGREVTQDAVAEAAVSALAQHPHAVIACGTLASGNTEVVQSRTNAMHAAEFARLAGIGGWVCYDEINWSMPEPEKLIELQDMVTRNAGPAAAEKWISDYFETIDDTSLFPLLYAHICLALSRMMPDGMSASKNILFPAYTGANTRQHAATLLSKVVQEFSMHVYAENTQFSPVIQRLLKYVKDNLSSSLSIKQFSEQAHMNANYLGRLFKDETGMYFSEYVLFIRINKAKKLLTNTDSPIGEIARQVGIYDVSYFTQCFKKQERISPSKYRQQILRLPNHGNS